MKKLFIPSVTVLALLISAPAQGQLASKLKDALGGKTKTEKTSKTSKSKGNSKFDKRSFLGNPLTDPVKNDDFKSRDEAMDPTGMGGYYYAYYPFTGVTEKVWVRYNNYTYRASKPERFSDPNLLRLTVYSKDLQNYDREEYVYFGGMDNIDRAQWEKAGVYLDTNNSKYFHFMAFDKDVFAINVPVRIKNDRNNWTNAEYDWLLDTIAINKTNTSKIDGFNASVASDINDLFDNKTPKAFVIFAKDRSKLEGFNDYETLKKRIIELHDKVTPELRKSYSMAVGQRPKASKTNPLFKEKSAAKAAKEGLAKSDLIPEGEKIHFVITTDDFKWETTTHKATGAILYKWATFYAVGERNPAKMKSTSSRYYLLQTHAKADYVGNGKYGEPKYEKVITGSIDITPEEFEAYKAYRIE